MISLIIVNFNTFELTKNCLLSLLANTDEPSREIIVIDNASSDNSVALLTEIFGNQIKIISNLSNLGFGLANNIGARVARGDILFFLNSDTVIKSNIISPIKAAFENNQKLGVIAPILLSEDNQAQAFAFGRFPDLMSVISSKIIASRPFPVVDSLKLVDWVSGAALIIRRDLFEQIGGWDEKYFLYFEDVDLCWRVKKRGYDIAVLDGISVTHFGGRSLSQNQERKKQYYLSQEYFFKKNYGPISALILKLIRWPFMALKKLKNN